MVSSFRNAIKEMAEALDLGENVLSIQLHFMHGEFCKAHVIRALTNEDIDKAKAVLEKYELRPIPEATRYLVEEPR